ncbi:beta-lactamase [Halomonas cupida]|uniref:Beta-lactamase n=1 Tax=Halomonas cupida TaxID=44933 RepID=A0A1M7JSN2_9GAMM|nr:class A beta-lactamase [Halomonas cupida]GEN24494.1 beta-lactamase [Halomonas cupida]SHM55998.1 beta-lactamase class A [Halomonas cupida]
MSSLTRRSFLSSASLLTASAFIIPSALAADGNQSSDLQARLAELEQQHNGRLGIALMNLATGAVASHRGDERFLFNSTIKVIIAATILARVDRGESALDRRLVVAESDLGGWTPITEQHLGEPGMTVAELCQAAVAWSDNAAANVLFRELGGPAAITDYLRTIGDDVTRSDRIEPALNEHDHDGDERDTTTPLAMLQTLRALLFGDTLSPQSRHQLVAWMVEGKTGDNRLRAGMPSSWLVAEKTGTSSGGNANDIGVAWPMDRGAVIAVAYTWLPDAEPEQRDEVVAEVGKLASMI